MSQNNSDIFRRKLEESSERERAAAVPMEFEGFPCKVIVMPRAAFIRAGRMPEYLTQMVIEQADNREPTVTPDTLTAEQVVEGLNFKRFAVCSVLAEPRVVASGRVPKGGYLYADLDESAPRFVSAVFAWVMTDCPMPKEEKGVEVLGVEDLARFPDGDGRGAGAQSGNKGEGVGAAAVGVNAADRKRTRRK
jgi:hypothetical protein